MYAWCMACVFVYLCSVCVRVRVCVEGNKLVLFCSWKVQRSSDGFQAVFGNSTAVITFSPFRVDFLVNSEVAVSVNNRGLLNIEHYRNKK